MKISKCTKLPPVAYPTNPPFGTIFTPHVFKMSLELDAQNSFDAEIIPLANEPFPPSMAVLHYGQSIFEGMKAYRQPDNTVSVFRPDLHAKRFRKSAQRMVMAEIPEEIFIEAVCQYTNFVSDNVPSEPGHSLYLRPLLIAAERKIKVGTSKSYLFYIMSTIAGSYFGNGGVVRSARVLVNRQFVRAYPNGLGETKTAANYAASIWPQRLAAKLDCDQVLYLDAIHHENIDELGGMNFFAIRGNELLTPKLNGCILNGVTRQSILELAPTLGLKPVEKTMPFTELKNDIAAGHVTEVFACGTAAIVSPIGELVFQETIDASPQPISLKNKPERSLQILDKLSAIQRGQEKAPGKWLWPCV